MDTREKTIRLWLERIERSQLSVGEYLSRYNVPFGRAQYYVYKRKMESGGVEAIRDGRGRGNHRRLTPEAEGFVKGYVAAHPEVTLSQLQALLKDRFQIEITPSGVTRCLKRLDCVRQPRAAAEAVERFYTVCGGFELVVALACHLGWPQAAREVITGALGKVKRRKGPPVGGRQDRRGRNRGGQFTAAYNRRRDVRERRFASVERKRAEKNFQSMSIATVDRSVLERKCLAALALPLITNNGVIRSVDTPLGNALLNLCGFNYKQTTLNKFLAELKYLGVAEDLLRHQVAFWRERWKAPPKADMELPVLCYYVDGNTKALWSKKRVKQSKVTMLGRVMGCLEQVFVHDCCGRPIYFETYSGHAPLGEYVLSLFEKIEDCLEGPGPALRVNRAIVLDGASNSVRTLRAFAAQTKYHYITSLDDNQWSERKVRGQGPTQRYRYGRATLWDGEVELEDSQQKGYLIVSRAIVVEWDYGKRTVLLTSLDPQVVGASEVVKAYFDRWPDQELTFRVMKSVASLHRVAGYGKQEVANPRVIQRQRQLRESMTGLRTHLAGPLRAIAEEEKAIASLVKQERKLRERSRIVDGRRLLPRPDEARLLDMGRTIRARERRVKAIEKPHATLLRRLRKAEREWLRLQGKETVYQVDVELDQIMTFFRVSLVNLYSYLTQEVFGGTRVSMNRLVQTVLLSPALIEETGETKTVTLQYNQKDPKTMTRLGVALKRINRLGCQTLSGKRIEFRIGKSVSGLKSHE